MQPRDTFVEVSKQKLGNRYDPNENVTSTSNQMEEILSPLKLDNSHRNVEEYPPQYAHSSAVDTPYLTVATPPRHSGTAEESPSSLMPMELSQSFSPFSPLHTGSMDFGSPNSPQRLATVA